MENYVNFKEKDNKMQTREQENNINSNFQNPNNINSYNEQNNNIEEEQLTKRQEKVKKRRKKERERIKKEVNKIERRRNSFFFILFKIIRNTIKFAFFLLMLLIVGGVIAAITLWPKVEKGVLEARETAYDKFLNIETEDFELGANTEIYGSNGEKIGEVNAGSFEYVDIKDVSPYITEGYIATEDRNFKTHIGVDFKANARAMVALFRHNGEITQGASTITQQVIKNNILTNEKSFERKITEIFIALDFEKEFSKKQIMEFYVNTNFYGNNCYGVEAACKYLFNKSAKDVTLSEAAMLIGISNAPTAYNPVLHYDKSIEKRNRVLNYMLECNVITQEEYNDAINENIEIQQAHEIIEGSTTYASTYAIYCAAEKLMELDGFEFKYTFADKEEEDTYREKYNEEFEKKYNDIKNGGYKIETYIDMDLQEKLQNAIDEKTKPYNETTSDGIYTFQSAGVCIDNLSNYVVAIVGGRTGSGEYNRAYQSARQPGSSIKPLVSYGPGFDTGFYYPSLVMKDEEIIGNYSPKNYGGGYSGNITIRKAIEKSTNTIAYKVLNGIGIENGLNYLGKMRFSHITWVDNTVESIALGGFTNGVSPLDMAKGYNTVANGGKYSDRTCLKSISYNGKMLYNSNDSNNYTQVYTEDTAFMLTSCLKDVVSGGTGYAAKIDGQIVAGKTGTTNSYKDAWFCGYTKYYTTSIWVGYDTPKPMPNITGGKLPTYIWQEFMADIHDGLEEADWEQPATVVYASYDSYGNMTNSSNERKDYFSSTNMSNASGDSGVLAAQINEATRALEVFEAHNLEDISDAVNYQHDYDNALARVNGVSDEYESSALRLRLENRFNEMYSLYQVYEPLLAEYNSDQSKQTSVAQQLDQDEIEIVKAAKLKQIRINNVSYYINMLNGMSNYTESTQAAINALQATLPRLQGYEEYENYANHAEWAIERAYELPRIEVPVIPWDEEDIPTN